MAYGRKVRDYFCKASVFSWNSELTSCLLYTDTVPLISLMFLCTSMETLLTIFNPKPFTHGASPTPQQKTFNYRICRAHIVAENAYGRLKRRLMKRNDMKIGTIPTIITCACVLHNICEVHSEWCLAVENKGEFPQPPLSHVRDRTASRPKEVQDALSYYYFFVHDITFTVKPILNYCQSLL